MRPPSYEYRRFVAGATAMHQAPEAADKLAEMFGVNTFLAEARAARELETRQTSYLYVMGTLVASSRYYLKIGQSKQPHIRLRQIQSGNGANMPPDWNDEPVRPLAIRLGGLALERAIHADLRQYRVSRTEWFDGDAGDIAVRRYIVGQDAWDVWQGEQPTGYDRVEDSSL